MDPFLTSSFGTFMMALFQGSLTVPSWQSFTYLAYGWAWTYGRQTITAYLWVSGATSVKHFSRYYAFLGGSLYTVRYTLWARVIRGGAALAPPAAVISISIDDTTMKKSGPHIEGGDYYRNGAGTARQEYRSLWGINLVWAIMHVPLQRWPGHHLSLPIGLELSLKAKLAGTLGVPYRSRSQLARCIVDLAAQHLPDRTIRVVADGEYATKAFLRHLPKQVHVICRFLSTAKLYQVPLTPAQKRRGAPRKKGDLIGSPKTLAQQPAGWQPHPQEAGALVQSWVGLWHSVLPGRPIRLVVVRRPSHEGTQGPKGKKPFGRLKPLEAFLSTEVSCRPADMLAASQERWAVEIDIRDGHASMGWRRTSVGSSRILLAPTPFVCSWRQHGRSGSLTTVSEPAALRSVGCAPGTDKRSPRARWTSLRPVAKSSTRREFFPYLGFSQLWAKINQGLTNKYQSLRRARN